MLEQIKQIYDEIIEASRKKKSFGSINVEAFLKFETDKIAKAISRRRECESKGIDVASDDIYQNIFNEKWNNPDVPKRVSRDDQYMIDAKKVRDLNLEVGNVLPCDISTYMVQYSYYQLSYEQFCSYIYWRTQIRKKDACLLAPIPYLWLYLAELCNFVEFDTVEETYDMFCFLFSIQKHQRAKTIVREAISDFLVYYGEAEILKEYDTKYMKFQGVKDSVSFLNGTHPRAFDFIAERSSYKIKESETYQESPETIRKYFMMFFLKMTDLLTLEGVDLLHLWIGQYQLGQRHEFMIKKVNSDCVVEKQLIEDGILLRSVTKDGVYEADIEALGQDVDPGECIFHRNYIIDYPIRFFDNELRKVTGKSQIEVSTKTLREMVARGAKGNLTKIIEFYESDSFADCVTSCLDLCRQELEQERQNNALVPKEVIEYIYCDVEFEDKPRKYAYIADDDSITVGDMVVVPIGPYNFESIAVVRSVKRCTASNAPYPPSRTKKIIRKHIEQ